MCDMQWKCDRVADHEATHTTEVGVPTLHGPSMAAKASMPAAGPMVTQTSILQQHTSSSLPQAWLSSAHSKPDRRGSAC